MKYHPHNSVLFVTFSIEEGILLLCNPLCKLIIQSCLARAQHLYPVKICHLQVQGTHIHLILVVDNPAHVPEFMRHFKAESAHMFNRLLGRRKRTVWCEGYDSPIVLTPVRAVIAIAYLYANPAKDNLEDSIDTYPGCSTWKMFRSGTHHKSWKRIHRNAVRALPRDAHCLRGFTKEAHHLMSSAKESHQFVLSPNAWMEAFEILDVSEQQRINDRIVSRIKALEERYRQKRRQEKRTPLGRKRLINQKFDLHYRPQRSGKKMICLSEDRKLRSQFIKFFQALMEAARTIRRAWLIGDYSQPYPLGLYPPSLPKIAEPLSMW